MSTESPAMQQHKQTQTRTGHGRARSHKLSNGDTHNGGTQTARACAHTPTTPSEGLRYAEVDGGYRWHGTWEGWRRQPRAGYTARTDTNGERMAAGCVDHALHSRAAARRPRVTPVRVAAGSGFVGDRDVLSSRTVSTVAGRGPPTRDAGARGVGVGVGRR